jgi:uracil-DNA glycosylase
MTILLKSMTHMDPSWQELLAPEFYKPYMRKLDAFLAEENRAGAVVYPPPDLIFNAFAQTPFDQVSVVIIGQDPYHGPRQAHGLAFSVPQGVSPPPSLKNIFKELGSDLGIKVPQHGCLLHWAKQGVLLLNATLTVRAESAASHQGMGWEIFTDRVVQLLCERQRPLIFLLWGKSAFTKFRHVEACAFGHHRVLTASHPSPLSAHTGFFGCGHFSKADDILKKIGEKPIDWATQ